jgi:outer membrane protein X
LEHIQKIRKFAVENINSLNQKKMKKMMMIAALMLMSIGAFAQEKQFAVGANIGVGAYRNSYTPFGFGPKFQFFFYKQWRAEASFNYWTKKNGLGGFMDFNANVHYVFNIAENVNIYPLAGATIVATHGFEDNQTLVGVNLGGGAEYQLTPDLKLNLEIKYQYAEKEKTYARERGVEYVYKYEAEGPVFQVGVAYCF